MLLETSADAPGDATRRGTRQLALLPGDDQPLGPVGRAGALGGRPDRRGQHRHVSFSAWSAANSTAMWPAPDNVRYRSSFQFVERALS